MSPEVWITKINNLLNSVNYRSPQPTIVIEKEVVKIPCKYCRALFDPTETTPARNVERRSTQGKYRLSDRIDDRGLLCLNGNTRFSRLL